jgi:sensor domain CHASE-containing protein
VRLKISYKIALLIALLVVTLGIAQVFVSLRVLIPSFTALERDNAHVDMDRVADALHQEIDQLAVATRDYADWSELYRFMDDRNSEDVAALSQQQFRDLNVDVLVLFDRQGAIAWSLASPSGSTVARSLKSSAPPAYVSRLPWRAALESGGSAEGLLSTDEGPLLASIAPILDGHGGGPARGGVLLGRYLTPAQIGRIAEQAHVKVELLADGEWRGAGTGIAAAGALPVRNDTMIERENVTEIYRTFQSVDGRPAFALRAEVPRTISQHGRRSVMFATLSLTVIGTLILVLLLITLRRMVLAPLAHLTHHAIEIGRLDDVTMRLNIQRSDEIGVLAQEFDRMMERLAAVRRELVQRSFEAGVGEMASGALHNIGNAITPLTVRIENLRERLRAAPTADVELTIMELSRSRTDAARHADCEALLELLARECVHVIAQFETELEVIRRQVDDVKQVLAEQKRFARRGPIIEDTIVEELIRQAGEVIPESLRAPVRFEVDPSVRAIGSRRLPRVALQQVIQNVVLNAAEAIREGGRGSGVVRVTAREVSGDHGGEDLLDLTFADDGAGVAPENLPRLFERGFTTKSHVTNSGFGLHWCANVLNALGGAIEARSEGIGHGACLHVRVPYQLSQDPAAREAA